MGLILATFENTLLSKKFEFDWMLFLYTSERTFIF